MNKNGNRPAPEKVNVRRGQTARKSIATTRQSGAKKKKSDSTLASSLVKALMYIVIVIVIAGFFAYFIITRANDAFAFVKDGADRTIVIEEGMSIDDLAKILEKNGIIKYPSIYKLYISVKGKSTVYKAGEYTVNPSMNYDRLNAVFAQTLAEERTTVVVVIPEGYTVKQIVATLVNKYGLSSEAELYDAIQNYPFDFWFVDELKNLSLDRTFRLEGYLYPDTYYYYSDASAPTILYKMLSNFENKLKTTFGNDYREDISRLCYERKLSFDEIIIIASMIQMEGKYDYEYGKISSVFNNRINNPSVTYGLLGSDATIQYILDKRTEELTQEQLETDSPYNTRLYKGLPPGPISNPTYLAINYAFYPDNTQFYYFVSKPDGTTLFGKTYDEHQENVRRVLENDFDYDDEEE